VLLNDPARGDVGAKLDLYGNLRDFPASSHRILHDMAVKGRTKFSRHRAIAECEHTDAELR
jgi:hypothetical protein